MSENEEILAMKWIYPGEKEKYSTVEMAEMVRKYINVPNYTYDVAIGTDSQMVGKIFQFISVVSVHRVGKGGIYFYSKEFVPRAKFPVENQKMRMFDETSRSIALGFYMKDVQKIVPTIHVDASAPHKKEFTAKFSDQLRGYVVSCGFDFMLKPESYAAHAIADKHTKKKTKKRMRRNKWLRDNGKTKT